MTEIEVRLARDEADIETARALFTDWYDWHWANYPADWPREGDPDWLKGHEHPLAPKAFARTRADLPELHKRPDGGILLAFLDGAPAGCVMYSRSGPDTAEFFRMFVRTTCWGHGLGQRLLDHMLDQMRADGYERAVFSSATFLPHARRMYEAAGFTAMAHPPGFPEDWHDKVYFMERALA